MNELPIPFFSFQELVSSKKNKLLQRLLIYGFIALVAIAIIVILSVFLTRPPSGSSEALIDDGPAISLEDVLEGRLYPHGFNGSWAGKDKMIFRDTMVSNDSSKVFVIRM